MIKRTIQSTIRESLKKYSTMILQVTKGFWIAMDDLSCKKGYVVYPGDEAYPIAENVLALPLTDVDKILE